jgi:hypothetical protein
MDTSNTDKLKGLLSEGRTSDALVLLLRASRADKQAHDVALSVLGEFDELRSDRIRGPVDEAEAALRLHGIHDKILQTGQTALSRQTGADGSTGKFLLRLGLFVSGIALLLLPLAVALKMMSSQVAGHIAIAGSILGMVGLSILGCWLAYALVRGLSTVL